MLLIFFIWIISTVVCFVYGYYSSDLVIKILKLKSPEHISFISYYLLGIVFLTAVLSLLTFFTNIGSHVCIPMMIAPLALLIFHGKKIKSLFKEYLHDIKETHLVVKLAFIFIFIIVIIKSAGPSEIFDEGFAYLPFFKSIEEYGIIKGFGNLHPNYVYNSHWHLLHVFFGFSFIPNLQSFYDFNGIFVIVCSSYCLRSADKLLKNNYHFQDIILALSPIFILRNQLSAPSTDLISFFWITIIACNVLNEIYKRKESSLNYNWAMIAIFISYAITVKITSVALGIFYLYIIYKALIEKEFRFLLAIIAISLLIVMPWFLRNIFLTGYPIYPLYQIDLFDLDWKMPKGLVQSLYDGVKYHVFYAPKEYTLNWWARWWAEHNTFNKLLMALVALGIIGQLIALVVNIKMHLRNFKTHLSLFILLLVFYAGFLAWWQTATEPRYGHGWIIFFILFNFAFVIEYLRPKFKSLSSILVVGMLAILGANLYKTIKENNHLQAQLAIPAGYPEVFYREINFGNFKAYRPEKYISSLDDRTVFYFRYTYDGGDIPCWDSPLPCIYDTLRIRKIESRGNSIKDGFRYKKEK